MLDERMIYSCAYWERARSLDEAQIDKLDMICRKLQLRAGESLLDIGCGWGGLARFAAERYGVKVTGVTLSKEQLAIAQRQCAGLPVTLLLQDYRELRGTYDKIVSVGMFEHVGTKNYAAYFGTVQRLLAPNGLFLLHTIGVATTTRDTDPWIDRYIFPNGKLPSTCEIAKTVEGRFIIEDWHNFGPDYDRTLMAWWHNFRNAWPALATRYNPRFFRMWKYYLLSCAGLFRSREGQLWQIVLTHPGRMKPYRSTR
jgi:cyclopropane-fatty-acyl-phospholipid synthase